MGNKTQTSLIVCLVEIIITVQDICDAPDIWRNAIAVGTYNSKSLSVE